MNSDGDMCFYIATNVFGTVVTNQNL